MSLPLAHLGGGPPALLQLLPLLIAALLYVRRCRTLAASDRRVPAWRQACFGSGLALILVALVSPLGDLDGELVYAHMGEHLLIGDLAALLLVLGMTGPLLQPLLAIRPIDRLRVLTHPAVALPLWAANLFVWHSPLLYQAVLASPPLHALQHAMFLAAGVLVWMPLVGPLPVPEWFGNGARVVYLVVVRLAAAVLGNVLMWSNTVFYPDYAAGEAKHGITAVSDQGIAGVIMMVEGGLVTLGVLAWLFLRWAQQDSERQRLLDVAHDHGVALEPARAARAVAAGQGRRLEERLKRS